MKSGARFLRPILLLSAFGLLPGCSDSPISSPPPSPEPPAPVRAAPSHGLPDRYDDEIQKATNRHLGRSWTWERYFAQLYQESLMDPSAVSHAGAKGIAQFLPSTWSEVAGRLGYDGVSPHSARHAIPAGAYYLRSLYEQWTVPRPEIDRKKLAMASYNAGLGGVLSAQRRCGNASLYADIEPCLPSETRTYNVRIEHWLKIKRAR